jgi:DNA invertase Pin-like site-specific DNA recombinase
LASCRLQIVLALEIEASLRPTDCALADVERDLIRTRTAEGRARAKARGTHMGRPSKLTPEQGREALARREAGEAPAEIARSYNVGRMTITRLK